MTVRMMMTMCSLKKEEDKIEILSIKRNFFMVLDQ